MLKFDGGNFNVVKKTLMMRSPDFCGIFQVWPNKCGICSRLSCIIQLVKFLLIKFNILVALFTIVVICVFNDRVLSS